MKGGSFPKPFAFVPGIHIRRHGPAGWANYARYRPWLRDEFCFRCVYCLIREQWVDMRRGFQIDHSIPQKLRPDLKADYDNLLYLCPSCNNLKGSYRLPDPCAVALNECLRFNADGTVDALDGPRGAGETIIEVLELDAPHLIQWRRRKIDAIATVAGNDWFRFVEEMCFPRDLPDLTVDPPLHNSRPGGIAESWFAKRKSGRLPEAY